MTARPGAAIASAWLAAWALAVHEQREWLTDLDAAIGDGDHGINLDRGLAAVALDLGHGPGPDDTAGTILSAAGRRLMGLVGGASGALYGRALIRAGEAVGGRRRRSGAASASWPSRQRSTQSPAWARRARARRRCWTRWSRRSRRCGPRPATSRQPIGCDAAAAAADAGARATIPLVARKGRASYLGERSVGHLDPGAASAALLVRSLATAADGR